MSVAEILLFYSTTSPASRPCLRALAELPGLAEEVTSVRLDSPQRRLQAWNGSQFQVRAVPTLVVIYSDGDTRVYQGSKKVVATLRGHWQAAVAAPAAAPPAAPVLSPPLEPHPDPEPGTEPGSRTAAVPGVSALDVNATRAREAESSSMSALVEAARKMERNRQTHLSEASDGPRSPGGPVRVFN